MKAMLKKKKMRQLYHVVDNSIFAGPNSVLTGDCSGLWGDCSGLNGDCSGITGDIDLCEISDDEREKGLDLSALVQ